MRAQTSISENRVEAWRAKSRQSSEKREKQRETQMLASGFRYRLDAASESGLHTRWAKTNAQLLQMLQEYAHPDYCISVKHLYPGLVESTGE